MVTLRSSVFALALTASALAACTVTVKSQTKFVGATPVTATSKAWSGQPISVFNQNGDVTVVGDPTATTVSVTTTPFAFADNQTDGNAAIADVTQTVSIDDSFNVICHLATNTHGSAANSTSGCDAFTVTVPSGTAAAPLEIVAHAVNGSCTAKGTLALSDKNISQIKSDNGSVTASASGSVTVHSENGEVTASLSPNKGSSIEASSGNGAVTLSLPKSFAADKIAFSASNGAVSVSGFGDPPLTATSTSRGTAGTGAASVTATSGNGDVTVQAQ